MKTGTTFLQNTLFAQLPDTALHSYGNGAAFITLADSVRVSAPFADVSIQRATMRDWIAAAPEHLHLFSWEGLVGHYLGNHRDFATLTAFLASTVPDAHVLLVLRRQDELLESLYKQALHAGHASAPDAFLNDEGDRFGLFRPLAGANIDVATLDFAAFVDAYETAFGRERVHVLPYEWMRRDAARFYDALGACLGMTIAPPAAGGSANVGYSRRAASVARLINPLFRSPANRGGLLPYRPFDAWLRANPNAGAGRRVRSALNAAFDPRFYLQTVLDRVLPGPGRIFADDVRARIRAAHEASNRRLDAARDLGLGALGYWD